MSEGAVTEERVGRLLVRRYVAEEREAGYREAALEPRVELRREPLDPPRDVFRSRFAWMALLALTAALFAFSVRVGSMPGLGLAGVVLVILVLIAILKSRRPPTLVRVTGVDVRVVRPDGRVEVSLEQIERLGVGRDMDPLHTVWVAVRGQGRVLLLDGLTAEEAELAESQLAPFVR